MDDELDELEHEKSSLEQILLDFGINKSKVKGELEHMEEMEEFNSDSITVIRRLREILDHYPKAIDTLDETGVDGSSNRCPTKSSLESKAVSDRAEGPDDSHETFHDDHEVRASIRQHFGQSRKHRGETDATASWSSSWGGWLTPWFRRDSKDDGIMGELKHHYKLSEEELKSSSQNRSALPRLFPEIPEHEAPHKKQIVFGGCAGMYHYFLGIAAVIQERFDLDNFIFAGVSGGCFPALCLSLGLNVRDLHETWNRDILREVGSGYLKAFTRLNDIVTKVSRKYLPEDSHIRAKDKLFISLTEFPSLKNHIVHHWKDRDDLIDCILASCFIPIFDRKFWTYFDQVKYVDGGLSNNKPIPYPDLPHLYITTDRWRKIPWHWYWCYTSEQWSDQLYLWGKEDALKHIDEFIELMSVKFD